MPGRPLQRDPRALRSAIAILGLASLVLFAPQWFLGRTFVLGDARVYRPFAEFSRERWLTQHVRTHWNPYVMGGVPASVSLADSRPQYLPDGVLDAYERLRPSKVVPLAGPLSAHVIGMCAVAALVWTLWGTSALAAVCGGLAWGLSPLLLVPLAFGHNAYVVGVSLLPVVLLALELLFAANTRTGAILAAAGLGVALAVQVLTGHPQVVVYGGLLVTGLAVVHTVRTRRWERAALFVASLGVAAAGSAAVWWPLYLYGLSSARSAGVGLQQAMDYSIAWREVLTFVWPQALGGGSETYWGGLLTTDYPRFFGSAVTLAALFGWAGGRKERWARRGVLLGVALAGVVLALGPRLGPIYSFLSALPFMRPLRVTSMALVLTQLSVALVSAVGIERALRITPRTRIVVWLVAAALVASGFALVTVLAPAYVQAAQHLRPDVAARALFTAAGRAGWDLAWRALLVALLVTVLALSKHARLRSALPLLFAVDLLVPSLPVLRRATAPTQALDAEAPPRLARVGQDHPRDRVFTARSSDASAWQAFALRTQPECRTNGWIRWRAKAWGGEHGSPPANYEEMAFLGSSGGIAAMGIRFVSSPPDVPQDTATFELLEHTAGEDVYRVRDGCGRVYATSHVRVLPSEAHIVHLMQQQDFAPRRVAFSLEGTAGGLYPGSETARIRWERDEPETLQLGIEADSMAFVVIADAWFPGWQAALDGRPVTMHRVDHAFRGVVIPAGAHRLRMTFVPEGWSGAVAVSRWTWALSLIGLLVLLIHRARARPTGVGRAMAARP